MSNLTVWKQEKNYQRLFWAGATNGIGDRFAQVAILALLYQITGSGLAIGILFTVRMMPFLLFAPIGGILADRFSKKTLLITTDLIRIPFALSLLLVPGHEQLWIIYVSSFILAAGEALYSPTRMSTIPALVKQDRLLYVNAIEQIMLGIVLVIGSSTGGVISYLFGVHVPFILNAATFLSRHIGIVSKIIPAPSISATNKWSNITSPSSIPSIFKYHSFDFSMSLIGINTRLILFLIGLFIDYYLHYLLLTNFYTFHKFLSC